MVTKKLYVEGGGDGKSLKTQCRRGFRKFLERAGLAGKMPAIVACGGRNGALKDFRRALAAGDCQPFLLVDAEAPVVVPYAQPWAHLENRDGWGRPEGATDEQCHLMVQVMESWFLADPQELADYYGQGFNLGALPKNPDIEAVAKEDVFQGLEQATRATKKRGYSKGDHSFSIAEHLDPGLVMAKSRYAKRLVEELGK